MNKHFLKTDSRLHFVSCIFEMKSLLQWKLAWAKEHAKYTVNFKSHVYLIKASSFI